MIAVEPSFGEDNVTLHVRLLEGMQTMINGLTYGALLTSSLEETIRVGSDGANVEVTIPYNVQYNLTTFAALCGYENQSDTLSLFYSELIGLCAYKETSCPGPYYYNNISED